MVVDTKQNHGSRKTDKKRRSKVVTYKQRKKLKFSNFASLFLDAYTHVFKSYFVFLFLLVPKLSLQYCFGLHT